MCEMEVSSVISVMKVIDISLWHIDHAIAADYLNCLGLLDQADLIDFYRIKCPVKERLFSIPVFFCYVIS